MKPKLGIYGDSYTREAPWPETKSYDERAKDVWSNSKIITDNYDVTNYGVPGSDFMYSYNKFKETHRLYDKIIFVVTSHLRHHFYVDDKPYFVTGAEQIDLTLRFLEENGDENISKVANITKGINYHYVYTMQDELYAAGVTRLVEEIKNIRPDAIVEYAFANEFTEKGKFHLVQVSEIENVSFRINLMKYKDCRPAHMTIENNAIFAEYIKKKLDGEDVSISVNDFITPHVIKVFDYFIKM